MALATDFGDAVGVSRAYKTRPKLIAINPTYVSRLLGDGSLRSVARSTSSGSFVRRCLLRLSLLLREEAGMRRSSAASAS